MATTAVRASPLPPSNKRKRADQDAGRNPKAQNTNGNSGLGDPSYAPVHQMLQSIEQSVNGMPGGDESSRTAQAALATPLQQSAYPEPGSYDATPGLGTFDDGSPTGHNLGTSEQALYGTRPGQSGEKATVGTPQWHQQRKDNHKEGMDEEWPDHEHRANSLQLNAAVVRSSMRESRTLQRLCQTASGTKEPYYNEPISTLASFKQRKDRSRLNVIRAKLR